MPKSKGLGFPWAWGDSTLLVSHGSLGGQRPASAVQRESEREMVRP